MIRVITSYEIPLATGNTRENESRPYFEKAAREGFQKRAEQEGRQWLGMLGDACFFGLGIPKDEPEAVKSFPVLHGPNHYIGEAAGD